MVADHTNNGNPDDEMEFAISMAARLRTVARAADELGVSCRELARRFADQVDADLASDADPLGLPIGLAFREVYQQGHAILAALHEHRTAADPAVDRHAAVVWKLDRLGRSLRHLVDTIAALADRGVGFRSLQEFIDTTTPGGKLVFHIFAALAEFERDLVRERTSAGLAAARARGRTGGRPVVMTEPKIRLAREMYASRQYTVAAIASTLGVSRASVYRHLGDRDG